MKKLLLFLVPVMLYAVGGDTLQYDANVEGLSDGDDFVSDLHWHPMKDSVQAIMNGRIGDVNVATDADIDASKIKEASTLTIDHVIADTLNGTLFSDTITVDVANVDTIFADTIYATAGIKSATLNTGQGDNELYDMNQNVLTTSAPTFNTINTGQGDNELYDMNQNVLTTSTPTFTTVNTGQGDNELYDMDQNVLTTSAPTFNTINTGQGAFELGQNVLTTSTPTFATINTGQGGNELYSMNQNVLTTSAPTFATVNTGQGNYELYSMNQNVLTTSAPTFNTINTGQGAFELGQNVLTTSTPQFAYMGLGVAASASYSMDIKKDVTGFNTLRMTNSTTTGASTGCKLSMGSSISTKMNLTWTEEGNDCVELEALTDTLALKQGGSRRLEIIGGNVYISDTIHCEAITVKDSGTFTGSVSGFGTVLYPTVYWTKIGNVVTASISDISGTSTGTAFYMTGVPEELRQITTVTSATAQSVALPYVVNNGTPEAGYMSSDESSTWTFFRISSAGWTGSGTKALKPCTFTYRIR